MRQSEVRANRSLRRLKRGRGYSPIHPYGNTDGRETREGVLSE